MKPKWEYRTIDTFTTQIQEVLLNELGDDGWELVTEVEISHHRVLPDYRYIFKRVKDSVE